MKKVLMLAVLVLGTTAMVNAQTATNKDAKVASVKEVRVTKKATKKAAHTKKIDATPAAAPAKK